MDLSIIIINYHNQELTIKYICKELSKLNAEYSVVIVNNGATPDSDLELSIGIDAPILYNEKFIKSHNNRYILSSSDNLGFACGNNKGAYFAINYLGAKYLLFSNNDIEIVDYNVIEVLKLKIQSNAKIGMIGPKIVGNDKISQSPEPYISFWNKYVWMYISTPFLTKRQKINRFNLDYPLKAKEGFHYKIMGSFFMMRSLDFLNCGGMDPKTFLYSEEVILSERLKAINKGVYYYPMVSVIHAHGATTTNTIGKININKYGLKSDLYYYKVYMNEPIWKLQLGTWIYKLIYKFL